MFNPTDFEVERIKSIFDTLDKAREVANKKAELAEAKKKFAMQNPLYALATCESSDSGKPLILCPCAECAEYLKIAITWRSPITVIR